MGGLQVSYSDIANEDGTCNPWTIPKDEQEYYWSEPGHMKTLSAGAVAALAEKGEFLCVPQKNIDDKSKADAVKKILVLLQVSWMVTQCIFRKAYGLPLTLLEIHTMVHVVCAFILYVCWFEKPLDVLNPDTLSPSDDRRDNFLKLLLFEDGARRHSQNSDCPPPFIRLANEYGAERQDISGKDVEAGLRHVPDIGLSAPDDILPVRRLDDEILQSDPQPENTIIPFGSQYGHLPTPEKRLGITSRDNIFRRKVLAALNEIEDPALISGEHWYDTLIERYRSSEHVSVFKETAKFPIGVDLRYTFLMLGLSSLAHFTLSKPKDLFLTSSAILLFPALYGGIHLTAWNSDFPSLSEQWIWKISCFIIMGLIPLFAITLGVLIMISTPLQNLGGFINSLFLFLEIMVCIINIIVFIAARLYIVIEVFISLRCVPIGVYLTPSWLQMIPHV
ncbi:hypothetical protein F4774DRAFT_350985 [Daldinia eschscholtzii]|nr:hypothetical protein F4774DRAFT_350985 [Daldinia eschscholtzii]